MKPSLHILLLTIIAPLLLLITATTSSPSVIAPSEAWAASASSTPGGGITPAPKFTPLKYGVLPTYQACPTAVPGKPFIYCAANTRKYRVLKVQ